MVVKIRVIGSDLVDTGTSSCSLVRRSLLGVAGCLVVTVAPAVGALWAICVATAVDVACTRSHSDVTDHRHDDIGEGEALRHGVRRRRESVRLAIFSQHRWSPRAEVVDAKLGENVESHHALQHRQRRRRCRLHGLQDTLRSAHKVRHRAVLVAIARAQSTSKHLLWQLLWRCDSLEVLAHEVKELGAVDGRTIASASDLSTKASDKIVSDVGKDDSCENLCVSGVVVAALGIEVEKRKKLIT